MDPLGRCTSGSSHGPRSQVQACARPWLRKHKSSVQKLRHHGPGAGTGPCTEGSSRYPPPVPHRPNPRAQVALHQAEAASLVELWGRTSRRPQRALFSRPYPRARDVRGMCLDVQLVFLSRDLEDPVVLLGLGTFPPLPVRQSQP